MSWEFSNLLRAIATTLVILIHASHHWWFGAHGTVDLSTLNWEVFFDTAINQVGRLAVPIFVILSGFGLAKSEAGKAFTIRNFYQRRGLRILPAYLFFSLACLMVRLQWQTSDWFSNLQTVGLALLNGSGDYHLYFLVIILQCYLTYPLLRRISFSPQRLIALLGFMGAVFGLRWTISLFGWFNSFAALVPDSNHCVFWLPYFLIGIWLGQNSDWFAKLSQQLSMQTWGIIWAIAAGLELGEFYWSALLIGAAEPVGHYGRPTVVFMSLTFALWALSWTQSPTLKTLAANKSLGLLGAASFTTYLIHTQILRLLQPLEGLGSLVYLPLAAIASWLAGVLIYRIVQPSRILKLIFGA